jgi:hypothetical protein
MIKLFKVKKIMKDTCQLKLSHSMKIQNTFNMFLLRLANKHFKKLNHKMIILFKVKKIMKNTCQLKLSHSMKIHDIFHIFFLRFASTNSLIKQIQSSSSLIIVNEKKEYEINNVLDSRYHYNKLQYWVFWIEY